MFRFFVRLSETRTLAAGFSVLVALGLLWGYRSISAFLDVPGENVALRTFRSAKHGLVVHEFYRSGGVTSDLIREFSLRRENEPLPDRRGNLFRCTVAGDWDGYSRPSPVRVRWDGDDLSLTYPKNVEVLDLDVPREEVLREIAPRVRLHLRAE